MSRCATALVLTLALAALLASLVSAAGPDSELPFVTNLDTGLEAARDRGKPVVVFFHAVWCPLCTNMKRETFRDPQLESLAGDFVWISVDIDRHLSTATEYGVQGTPTIFLLDSEGRQRSRLQGFEPAESLARILTEFKATLQQPAPGAVEVRLAGDSSDLTYTPKGYRSRAICFSQVGYGPLALDSQSPFQSLRLGIRPRTPSTLGRGQYQVRGSLTWVNIWNVEDLNAPDREFFLDLETLQGNVGFAYGITDTLQIEGEIQSRGRFGGTMDSFTQGFHDVFGIEQNGRDEVPKNAFNFELAPEGRPGVRLSGSDRGTYSRGLAVTIQHNVTCGSRKLPAFSYSFTGRLETIDTDLGGSPFDLGGSVALSRRWGRLYFYATLGLAWFGSDDFRGVELTRTQAAVLLAGEWRFGSRMSLLLQYLYSQGVVEDFGPFSDASHEITLGWKWELRRRGTFGLGLIENVVEFDNSPDFGVHAEYTQRF